MRLSISKSKNATSLYVKKDVTINGKRTTKIVEKLGTVSELSKEHEDPIAWAKEYIKELNRKDKEQNREIIVKYNQSKLIDKDIKRLFNGGYLFLQQLYHQLKLHKICNKISAKYKFTYNLDSICICQPKIRSKDHLILGHFLVNKCASKICVQRHKYFKLLKI